MAYLTPQTLLLIKLEQEHIDHIVSGVLGGAANVQDSHPLAPLQEGMLFHHLMAAEGTPTYYRHCWGSTAGHGLWFLSAVQTATGRHDILRTAVWEGLPEPVQVVWRQARLPIEEVSSDAAAEDAATRLRARSTGNTSGSTCAGHRCCAPSWHQIPSKYRWLLLLVHHHLADDRTTLAILIEEVQAHLLGRAESSRHRCRSATLWRRRGWVSARKNTEMFFRRMLGDVTEPTAPIGLVDARSDSSDVDEARVVIDAEAQCRLRARHGRSGRHGEPAPWDMGCRCWHWGSGRQDVVFGTVLFGRMQGGAGVDRVPGFSHLHAAGAHPGGS